MSGLSPVQQVRAAAHELENVCRAILSPPPLAHPPVDTLPADMVALLDRLRDVPGTNRAPLYATDGRVV
jgi:hypothetical protein